MLKSEKLGLVKKKIEDMTPVEQRMTIARDVIAQIKAKKFYVASNTGYVSLAEKNVLPAGADPAKYKLAPKMKKCTVCALGAMFIADISKDKNYSFQDASLGVEDDYIERYAITARLGQYFTNEQMNAIEEYFEYSGGWMTDDERLMAICQNLIDNKGQFDYSTMPESDEEDED
jgi:hypothetical protein